MTDLTDEQMERLLKMAAEVHTVEFQQRLAEREAARTDPWRWYCRLCGETGESQERVVVMADAHGHIDDGQPCGHGRVKAESIAGRLLHVWSWG
jgi:hypothetical protein